MYSPGCNARSVAEYITAALLHLAVTHAQPLAGQTLGIVGVGNVGSKVVQQAQALGMKVLLCDPPRQRSENTNIFCDLDTLLSHSDFVTLHVPLEKSGPDATWHMANRSFFARMKRGSFFINAARGAVVESGALLEAIDIAQVKAVVLDTWEGEPNVSEALLSRVEIGTPHIAGHSFEGKVNGTIMVYEAACRFLQRPSAFNPVEYLPQTKQPLIPFTATGNNAQDLHALVQQIYDIRKDDAQFRDAAQKPGGFDALRRNYPIRREFVNTTVTDIPNAATAQQVSALGFSVA